MLDFIALLRRHRNCKINFTFIIVISQKSFHFNENVVTIQQYKTSPFISMQTSASIDFDEVNFENDPPEEMLAGNNIPQAPSPPEIKFRVPSVPFLDTNNILNHIKQYEIVIEQLQTLLLWKRPFPFSVLIVLLELTSLIIYLTNMGFVAFLIFIIFLYFIGYSIDLRFHRFIIEVLFPPIENNLPEKRNTVSNDSLNHTDSREEFNEEKYFDGNVNNNNESNFISNENVKQNYNIVNNNENYGNDEIKIKSNSEKTFENNDNEDKDDKNQDDSAKSQPNEYNACSDIHNNHNINDNNNNEKTLNKEIESDSFDGFFEDSEDNSSSRSINEDDKQDERTFLKEFSTFLSVVGSRLHTFYLGCSEKSNDQTFFGQLLWISFLFCFFILSVIIRTFPFFYCLLHLIIFLPGIIFHPSVNPIILPYLQRLMVSIAPKILEDN